METQLRKTGIGALGDMPWGTHFCNLYKTKGDLLDTLIPYFKAGLEGGEFSAWVISEPLTEQEAWQALRQAVPNLDHYVFHRSLEVLNGREWYLKQGLFDLKRVIRALNEKLDQALARGYTGMRMSGDAFWLEANDWITFGEYERELNESITDQHMMVLCTYPLAERGVSEILDAARSHQFVLARRDENWDVIETLKLKATKAETKRSTEELEGRVAERTEQLMAVNAELLDEVAERKRVEEPLRESGELLGAIFEKSAVGVALTDPDGGFVKANRAYQLLEQRVRDRTREIERRREAAEGLRDILAALNSKSPVDEILNHIVAQACNLLGTGRGAIFQFEGGSQSLRLLTAQGFGPVNGKASRVLLGWDVVGKAARTHSPILISDLADYVSKSDLHTRAPRRALWEQLEDHMSALLAVPVTIKDETFGVIVLAYREPHEFTDEEIQLAVSVADQAALAIENARLSQHERQLAVLEERQRLARELHDSVSQALYTIGLDVRRARNRLERDPRRAAEPLDNALSLTEATLAEMRALIFGLRPESLETEGLVAALQKQAGYLKARYNVEVQTLLGEEPTVSLDVKGALYRIAREALQNTLKHAHATRVELQLNQTDKGLVLGIGDNGIGFDAAQSFPGHLGLHTMKERAVQFGGTFEVESGPELGTHIRIEIPN